MSHVAFFQRLRGMVGKYGLNLAEFIEEARRVARTEFDVDPNPIGIRNRKVGGVSTYRKLGDTCPECVYAKICYAYGFPSNIHGHKARAEALPSLFSAAIGAAFVDRFGTIIRLHTTGGFARPGGAVDEEYVEGLVALGSAVNVDEPWAYSFTHFTVEEFYSAQQRLSHVGIEVLYSDVPVVGGAVVWDHEEIEELRVLFPHIRWSKCRYQVDKTPCVECKLCLNARDLEIGIVFHPHAGHKGIIAERSEMLLRALASATQSSGVTEETIVHLLDVEPVGGQMR